MPYRYTATFTSTARVINPTEQDRFIAKASLLPLKGLLPEGVRPEDNPDLLYIAAAGAVAGLRNRNDDAVSAQTALAINRTCAAKFISVDHSRDRVVGVVLYPGLSRFGTNEPLTEAEAAALNEPFNMAFAGVLWKTVAPQLSRYIRQDNGAVDKESLSISWEVAFNDWEIGVGGSNLWDTKVVKAEDPEFGDLEKRLRAKGGKGKSADGEDIFRIITGDAVILGYSIVPAPAAHVKGILPITTSSAPAVASAAIETVDPVPLPDGEYAALRYGYTIEMDGKEFATKQGRRNTREHAISEMATVEGGVIVAVRNIVSDTPDNSSATTSTEPETAPLIASAPEAVDSAVASAAGTSAEPPPAESFITPKETRVTQTNASMKIESLAQLKDQWSEIRKLESSASVESFVDAFQKANDKHLADLNATKELATSLEQSKAAAEQKAAQLESDLATVRAEVESLKNAAVAAEQNAKFQERMAALDESFDLDDEDRQLLAPEVRLCADDAAFAAFKKKQDKLMSAKKKGAKAAVSTAAATTAITPEVVVAAVASITPVAGQTALPVGQVQTDTSLVDEMEAAFGSAIRIDGKTVTARRAAKAAAAPKE